MRRELHTDLSIETDPQRVWHVLVDLPAWGDWNPVIIGIAGRLETGERMVIKRRRGDTIRTQRAECLRVLPVQELSWLHRLALPGLLDTEERFVVEATEEGTRLLLRRRFSGVLLPLAWWRLRRHAGEELRHMATALRRTVTCAPAVGPVGHGALRAAR